MSCDMGIRVCSAISISDPEVGSFALPEGFPILVDESDHVAEPIEPINSYLFCAFSPVRRRPIATAHVANTAIAVAFDLRDWWEFLRNEGLSWQLADQEDLERYRDIMLHTYCPSTARRYATATIRRRMHSVMVFYDWARTAGRVVTVFDRIIQTLPPPPQDEIALAHISNNSREKHAIYPTASRTRWDNVYAFDKCQYQQLVKFIGNPARKCSRD